MFNTGIHTSLTITLDLNPQRQPTRLNVYKNDNESYDFTNPTLGTFPEGIEHFSLLSLLLYCLALNYTHLT